LSKLVQINTHIEVQALNTILKSKDQETREYCLSRMNLDLFGAPALNDAFTRLSHEVERTGTIPNKRVFLNDIALSEEAKALLLTPSESSKALQSRDDVVHLVNQMETYRRVRVAFYTAKKLAKYLASDNADMDMIQRVLLESTARIQADSGSEPELYHVGDINNSDDILERCLDKTNVAGMVPTGFKNFDSRTMGWRRGELVVLASHFKGGKSTVKLNILGNQYFKHNLRVCDISLEMNQDLEYERVYSYVSGVPAAAIHNKQCTPDQEELIRSSWKRFKRRGEKKGSRFTVWPASTMDPSILEMVLKPHKYDVIALDYLNLMTPPNGREVDPAMLGEWCKQLKRVAARLNCVIILLTQLDATTGDIRYFRAAKEDANNLWIWKMGDLERSTHRVKVEQMAARSHEPFPFYLEEDFAHMRINDWQGEVLDDDGNTTMGAMNAETGGGASGASGAKGYDAYGQPHKRKSKSNSNQESGFAG
jgi:replicative DNA helicase